MSSSLFYLAFSVSKEVVQATSVLTSLPVFIRMEQRDSLKLDHVEM